MGAKPGTPAEGFAVPVREEQFLPPLEKGIPIYIPLCRCLLQCDIPLVFPAYDLLKDDFLFQFPHLSFLTLHF